MYYLVAYVINPSGSYRRALQRVFGTEFRESALPVVSQPCESFDEAEAKLQEIRHATAKGWDDDAILIEPDEEKIPLVSEEAALCVVRRHEAWAEFLESFHAREEEVRIETKEHARCWVVVAVVPSGGIPPGVGFVIDKHSERIFPHRYVDVVSLDGEPL